MVTWQKYYSIFREKDSTPGTDVTERQWAVGIYEVTKGNLRVGNGVLGPVRQEVWEVSVSGFQVLQSWLAYRMKKGAGKKSSPLDDIRPERREFDEELLDLLWVLEHIVLVHCSRN